jgi:hypothetical protein
MPMNGGLEKFLKISRRRGRRRYLSTPAPSLAGVFLVPKLSLGTPSINAKLSFGSHFRSQMQLGNELKKVISCYITLGIVFLGSPTLGPVAPEGRTP